MLAVLGQRMRATLAVMRFMLSGKFYACQRGEQGA